MKTKLKRALVIAGALICLSAIWGMGVSQASTGSSEAILQVLQNYFESANTAIISGDEAALRANLAQTTSDRALIDKVVVDIRKERGGGVPYVGSSTKIRIIDGPSPNDVGDANIVTLIAEENRALNLSIRGGPEKTEERIEHILSLQQLGGTWRIVSDAIKDAPGPQTSEPGQKPIPPSVRPTRSAPNNRQSHDNVAAPGDITALATYYNRTAASNYAYNWALSRNPSYRSWSNDCTNFISQAVRAGNWFDVSGWYLSNSAWWYNFANQSRTWINAESWWWFTYNRPRGSIATYFSDMRIGDVLQLDFDRNNVVDHSMVVTKKDANGTIYLSYHTTDTRNKSINTILSQYPSAWYYGWKINYTIN